MRYEMMFPTQIREAIDKNTPVVMALGVIEYHAEHLCPGVDTLVVQGALEELEKDMELVLLPPFWYGAGSYAVAGPERKGGMHIDSGVLNSFARQLFYNLLRIGFRNIRLFYHHQSENFASGMPNDLAFRLAAKQEIFAFLDREKGDGWWGEDLASANYYSEHEAGTDPFSWIRVEPFMCAEAQAQWPIDHAGEQETSLMMAFCPDGINMSLYDNKYWYAQHAPKANMVYANNAKTFILAELKNRLSS
jgi:creatinine amidohydrolase